MKIETYALAYIPTTKVDLCATHAASPPAWMPPLGRVEHGSHWSDCVACKCGDLTPERLQRLVDLGFLSQASADKALAWEDSGSMLFAAKTLASGVAS